jgi:hypothetical protein
MRNAELKRKVTNRADADRFLTLPGEMVLVQRGVPRSLVMVCPDGCGDIITINLDSRAGKAWRLYTDADGLTLFPSVWRDTGCGAHFILWENIIYFAERDHFKSSSNPLLERRILSTLTPNLESYSKIADRLNVIPWNVLTACRNLVASGAVHEGRGTRRGSFRRAK